MSEELKLLLAAAAERAENYLVHVDEARVFPDQAALENLAAFDEALPAEGRNDMETLQMLDQYGSPAAVASAGPRYFGFVVGGSLPVTVGANWLATAWDQVASSFDTSPLAHKLEQVTAKWLLEILDLPRESSVGLGTGATMASFTALAAARHHLLKRQGWDVERDGLFGAPEITVVVGDEVHATILKALSMLGFGSERIIRVPVDNNGAMILSGLPVLDDKTLVCVQAGNVNSGAFDPIGEICDLAEAVGAWVHVDGAFGLWARASKGLKPLTEGIERADSWSADAHKWLNTPYDCGIVMCRHKKSHFEALSISAAYLRESDQAAKDLVPEFSRRARAVEVWAALRSLGCIGVGGLVDRCCGLATIFARGLSAMGLTIHNEVVLNQVVASWGSEDQTRELILRMQQEGTCWFGPTVWQGHVAFRISVSSWKTTEQDVEKSLKAFRRIITEIQ